MREINTVLVTWNYQEKYMKRLFNILSPAKIVHVDGKDQDAIGKALKTADLALIGGRIDERYINAKNLKWIQFSQAGVEQSALPQVFDRGIIMTMGAGCSAHPLAEHVLFFILSLNYKSHHLYDQQRLGLWDSKVLSEQTSVHGKTLGIIGYGNIGKKVAEFAKAIGMNVIAYKRSLEENIYPLNRLYCAENGEDMDELLRVSDFVLIAASLTDGSHHMIGEQEFAMMKPSASIINISRGSIIDEEALIKALYARTIAGAGLDTVQEEPLSEDSLLWHAPNTIITPHHTPNDNLRTSNLLDILEKNIALFKEGKPMINLVTRDDVYTKG